MNAYVWSDMAAVVVLAAVVAVLGFAMLYSGGGSAEFQAKCKELGGTVVHDGRQDQCLKP